MVQPKQNPKSLISSAISNLFEESEMVMVIFRSAFIIIAALAPLMDGGRGFVRLAMSASIAGAILYTLILGILYWTRIRLPGQRVVIILLDIMLITTWIYLTWNNGIGQPGSPLFSFYYVILIAAALWFGVLGVLLTASVISLVYLFISINLTGFDPFTLIDILYRQVLYIFMIAILSGYLVDSQKRERDKWAQSQVHQAQFQEQYRAAQELYEILIPTNLPEIPGLEMALRFHPAQNEMGGDFYEVFALSPGRVVIAMADVSGKAAQKLPILKAAFKAAAQVTSTPGEVLSQVNRIVYPLLQPDMLISACVIILELPMKRLYYANAGQNPPVFVRYRTRKIMRLETGGLLLGVEEETTYPTEEQSLEPNDTLCLYTDGVTEARNTIKEEYGVERLEARVLSGMARGWTSEEIAENVFQSVKSYSAGLPPHDDLTLLVIRTLPI